jgi:MFS family permease
VNSTEVKSALPDFPSFDFKVLMSARILLSFAVQMQAVIVGWQMYALTHDPLSLGLIGLAEAIPALGLALYAGYLIDRGNPLTAYKRVLSASLLSAAIVLFSQLFRDHLELHSQIIALYCASLVTGSARAFFQPAVYSIVPQIVKRSDLSRSSAWMSTTIQISRGAGPAIGGLIYGFCGFTFSAAVVCGFIVLALVTAQFLKFHGRREAQPVREKHTPRSFIKELFSGAAFVYRSPILISAMSLDMISVLFGGVTALLPIYASDILMVGPQGLGILRAAPAIGAAISAFILTRVQLKKNAGTWLFSSVAGFGVCILVFGASQNFMLSLWALGLSGAFDSVSMIIRTAAVQLASPDNMRARISSVNTIFIGSSNELGQFESGVAAKLMGTVPSVYFGGVMCLLTVAVTSLLSKPLRKLDLDELRAN